LLHCKIKRPCAVGPQNYSDRPSRLLRDLHHKNAAQAAIDSANSAEDSNSASRADRAALAICAVVPYIPAPEPALAGLTVESTALDNGAITSPWP
jgi:hypothetical protein